MDNGSRYAIGQQDFSILREEDAYYADKTPYIAKIIRSRSKYYFLARPRRFGKSLFLSTLRYFFEGRKELFRGLFIESVDWDWEPYPVLYLDLNTDRYDEPGLLENVLANRFRSWEEKYGLTGSSTGMAPSLINLSSRFANIIAAAHKQTGKPVVILVDEYDKPLVGNLNKNENFEHYRTKLASLYSNFKSSAEHIRLVFLTGVSRFSKLSVFSDLNNLEDISFDNDFADICGITEKELHNIFQSGIKKLADIESVSFREACDLLKEHYDGYKFTVNGSDIYNPWSLLNALKKSEIINYWNQTGKPTIVAEALKSMDVNLEETLTTQCDKDTLAGLDIRSLDPIPLMYQTGYITIKGYDHQTRLLTLGIPNREVRDGIFKELLPLYVKVRRGNVESTIRNIINSILNGKPTDFMRYLEAFMAGIPYDLRMDNENNFQNAIYILLSLIGVNTKVEERTSAGRIDLSIETSKYLYIIELKYDGSPQKALAQINEKGYTRKYLTDHRKIFKIGASFSVKTRTIENCVIEEEK
ncbi:MAG: ATP-binding protein [Muribaculaceae bacterium]|nr:ATP-binding protein [Muribaculaceae bacterium]